VSDTRTEETDSSGRRIRELLVAQGHEVGLYRIVKDEPRELAGVLGPILSDPGIEAVITNGGTGIAPRDRTFEVIRSLLDKEIEGFGELFRVLSYEEIGPAAMLSRALAGVAGGKVIVSLPGSTAAVELGMTKLVLPELGHMVFLLAGSESGGHTA
jgi:molybdenum cofactor biosynthesis protein B